MRTLTIAISASLLGFALPFSPSAPVNVNDLMKIHSSTISQLKIDPRTAPKPDDTGITDLFYLRHILEFDVGQEEDDEGALNLLGSVQKTLSWRRGAGRSICAAAASAIASATSSGSGWDNGPVVANAPHSDKISTYLTGDNVITTTDSSGDLVYCIRAGQINDKDLMAKVTVEEMSDFFLYAKEVNTAVADKRSMETGKLCRICTANDLSGVNLFGDASFRKALSMSSTKASEVYPAISAETFLLNLPTVRATKTQSRTPNG